MRAPSTRESSASAWTLLISPFLAMRADQAARSFQFSRSERAVSMRPSTSLTDWTKSPLTYFSRSIFARSRTFLAASMSLSFWLSWMRYCSCAVTQLALAWSTLMLWSLSCSTKPEESRSMSLSPFLTSTPGSMIHLMEVAMVLPLLPDRTVQTMSPFLADSREPRSTMATLSFSARTGAGGPGERLGARRTRRPSTKMRRCR